MFAHFLCRLANAFTAFWGNMTQILQKLSYTSWTYFSLFYVDPVFKLQFAILCAGFKSRSSVHNSYYEDKIDIPTLHIFGNADQVIPTGK